MKQKFIFRQVTDRHAGNGRTEDEDKGEGGGGGYVERKITGRTWMAREKRRAKLTIREKTNGGTIQRCRK